MLDTDSIYHDKVRLVQLLTVALHINKQKTHLVQPLVVTY